MNTQTGAANTLPGYTGYKPAYIREEQEAATIREMTMRKQQEGNEVAPIVPGYQGYVPQLKSENVFGSTYGKTTTAQKGGQISAGFDCDN